MRRLRCSLIISIPPSRFQMLYDCINTGEPYGGRDALQSEVEMLFDQGVRCSLLASKPGSCAEVEMPFDWRLKSYSIAAIPPSYKPPTKSHRYPPPAPPGTTVRASLGNCSDYEPPRVSTLLSSHQVNVFCLRRLAPIKLADAWCTSVVLFFPVLSCRLFRSNRGSDL